MYRRRVTITGMFFAAVLSVITAADDTVASWNFDDGSFDGRRNGGVSFVDGVSGKALAFDGSSSAEASVASTPGNAVTLETWVKLDTTQQEWSGIVTRWNTAGGTGYSIVFRSAGAGFRFIVNGDDKKNALVQTEKEQILPDVWYHVAGTYDGKNLMLYLNGVPFVKAAGLAVPAVDGPVLLGKAGSWAKDGLRGSVDEVRVYSRVLTAAEINARYRAYVKGVSVKRVVCDFEDVGTWRHQGGEGVKGKWFAGHIYLSSTKKETCGGDYAGVIRYSFTEPAGPYRHRFIRAKIMEQKMQSLSELSFFANPKGHDGRISIELSDIKGKKVTTEAVTLEKDQWKEYSIPFDETHAKGASSLDYPVYVSAVNFISRSKGDGEIYLDDIALSGETTDGKQMISVSPVYRGIGYMPDEPVLLDYRVRNGMNKPTNVSIALSIADFFGKPVTKAVQAVDVGANAESVVHFTFPAMAVGHYRVVLSVSGAAAYGLEDMFGVFTPNGKRINRSAMFFGCEDQEMWKGDEENALHKTWMAALGIDIERFGITGGRFEFEAGNTNMADGFTPKLQELAKYDIDSFVSYGVVPEFTGGAYRKPPTDYAAFAAHVRNLGSYLSQFPGVKYIEFWNEPDLDFFQGTIDDYLAMLKTFYTEFKKTAPNIRVTTGGVTVKHPKEKKNFTRDVYVLGKGYYDVAAFHAHGPHENYMARQEMVEAYLKEAGVTVPICNTEAGDRSLYDYGGYRSQAVTLVKKITYAKSRPMTEFYSWFTLKDYWDMDPGADDSFGLVNTDNRVKPAFVAYNELIRELANTSPDGAADLDARLDCYRFTRASGGTVYVLWPKTAGANVVFTLNASAAVTRTDMFGKSETLMPDDGKVSITVSGYPIYLAVGGKTLVAGAKSDVNFLSAPSAVYAVPGGTAVFSATVTNIWNDAVSVDVALNNDGGSKIAGGICTLAKDAAARVLPFSVTIDSAETFGQKNFFFSVNAAQVKVRNAVKPLALCVSYPMSFVPGGFVVNGSLSAAAGLKPIVVDSMQSVVELTFDPTIPQWKNAKDLSVKTYAAHDGKGFYFACDVADDVHVQQGGGADIVNGDSVEIGIMSDDGTTSSFALALTSSGPIAWGRSSAGGTAEGRWDIPRAVQRAGARTVYEVYIPFDRIGFSIRSDATPVRFNFLVNEDDGKGRVRFMEWFGGLGRKRDANLYGFGLLSPAR